MMASQPRDAYSESMHDMRDRLALSVKQWPSRAPAPLNLWMNVKVNSEGELKFEKPVSAYGDRVVFRAEKELVVVLSACPMDRRASESWVPVPREVEWEVLG